MGLLLVADVNHIEAAYGVKPTDGFANLSWVTEPPTQKPLNGRRALTKVVFFHTRRFPGLEITRFEGRPEVMKGATQSRIRRENTTANEQHPFRVGWFLGGSHAFGKTSLLLNQSLVGVKKGRFQTDGLPRCGKDIK
jgi:hypothetical protein